MLILMLLFIFRNNEVDSYSVRVCKNALEKFIFSDFFHSPSTVKDPIWEVVSRLNTPFPVKINQKNFSDFADFWDFVVDNFLRCGLSFMVLVLPPPREDPPIPQWAPIFVCYKK